MLFSWLVGISEADLLGAWCVAVKVERVKSCMFLDMEEVQVFIENRMCPILMSGFQENSSRRSWFYLDSKMMRMRAVKIPKVADFKVSSFSSFHMVSMCSAHQMLGSHWLRSCHSLTCKRQCGGGLQTLSKRGVGDSQNGFPARPIWTCLWDHCWQRFSRPFFEALDKIVHAQDEAASCSDGLLESSTTCKCCYHDERSGLLSWSENLAFTTQGINDICLPSQRAWLRGAWPLYISSVLHMMSGKCWHRHSDFCWLSFLLWYWFSATLVSPYRSPTGFDFADRPGTSSLKKTETTNPVLGARYWAIFNLQALHRCPSFCIVSRIWIPFLSHAVPLSLFVPFCLWMPIRSPGSMSWCVWHISLEIRPILTQRDKFDKSTFTTWRIAAKASCAAGSQTPYLKPCDLAMEFDRNCQQLVERRWNITCIHFPMNKLKMYCNS